MKADVTCVVFSGNNDCEHEFVTDYLRGYQTFTTPPIIITQRICEHCGRVEGVKLEGDEFGFQKNNFKELYERFHIRKQDTPKE